MEELKELVPNPEYNLAVLVVDGGSRDGTVDYRRRGGGKSKVSGTFKGTIKAGYYLIKTALKYRCWVGEKPLIEKLGQVGDKSLFRAFKNNDRKVSFRNHEFITTGRNTGFTYTGFTYTNE